VFTGHSQFLHCWFKTNDQLANTTLLNPWAVVPISILKTVALRKALLEWKGKGQGVWNAHYIRMRSLSLKSLESRMELLEDLPHDDDSEETESEDENDLADAMGAVTLSKNHERR